jgi:hypothetical protein
MSDYVGDMEAPELVKCSVDEWRLNFFVFFVLFVGPKMHQRHTRMLKRSMWWMLEYMTGL